MNHRHVYVEITYFNLPGTLLVKPKWQTVLIFEIHLERALFDGYFNNLKDPIVMPPPFSMPSKL